MHNDKKGQTPIAKMVLREMIYNDKKGQTSIAQNGAKRNYA